MNSSKGRFRIPPALWLIPLLMGIGLAFFILMVPADVAALPGFASPTPTQENLWGYSYILKPANTATSIQVPTETPPPAATPTAGSMVMEIVEDTPLPAAEPAQGPVSVPSYGGSKYVMVDISEQHMYVYESDALIYSFVASTGMGNSTRIGSFQVQSKIPNAYGSTWNIWMPSWLGIYWSHGLENGIHALPILSNGATLWAGFLGRPVSYGCVVLDTYDAQVLYDWADMGTPVEIQW